MLARMAALVTVCLWTIFPSGTMPGHTATGALTVMLCTGDGPVAMTLNADGQPAPADKEGTGSHSGKPCSFAAAHVLAVPPLGELAAHVTAVFVHSAPLPVAVSARQAPAHSLADSRAPPAFL